MSPTDTGFPPSELRKFSESGRIIAAALGTSVEVWARAEAGVILKTWAGRTKVATQQKVDRNARNRAIRGLDLTRGGDITVNTGIKAPYGRVFLRTKSGKYRRTHEAGFRPVSGARGQGKGDHYKKGDWIDLKEAIAATRLAVSKALPTARRAIGLARQSIVQIADDLGLRLETVRGGGTLSAAGLAKARAALASNGQHYSNGTGLTARTAQDFTLTLINRYPKNGPLGMDRTLRGVIAGRIKYFEKNLAEATFLSASRTAKAYPYLEVLRSAA